MKHNRVSSWTVASCMTDRFSKEGVGRTQPLSKSVPDLGGPGYSF